ncbi:LCP family protein [Haloimpatiens sp. FM7330]|uniref:LCP family protein n=1 Tax=Haloimpatiens sp. FM7330 TaxID=3298610 RepID=UPI00362898BB
MSNKRKKSSKVKKFIIFSFIIILLVGFGSYFYAHSLLNKVQRKEISKNDSDLGITKKTTNNNNQNNSEEIINIALFGLDRRQKSDIAHSDSTIILTIDKKHKNIKLSSIMRDTYVEVKGHGKTKFTHAYAYGGPELTLWTLNHNFNLDIRHYVSVDFFDLEKIIDILGGVTIDVKPNEVKYINKYMKETSNLQHKSIPILNNSGVQVLNGRQAVSYARIRSTGGGDYERTARQRTVLNAIVNKLKNTSIIEYPSLVSKLLPFVETDMDSDYMLNLGKDILMSNIKDVKQSRFPLDSESKGQMINKVWYLVTDIDATTNQIHDFIYKDIQPEANKSSTKKQ